MQYRIVAQSPGVVEMHERLLGRARSEQYVGFRRTKQASDAAQFIGPSQAVVHRATQLRHIGNAAASRYCRRVAIAAGLGDFEGWQCALTRSISRRRACGRVSRVGTIEQWISHS